MQRILLSSIITFLSFTVFGQGIKSYTDTLRYTYRTGGKLDSIDLVSESNSSTFEGGGWNTRSNVLEPAILCNKPNGQLFLTNTTYKPFIYSGLPHLGIAYMFGSNAQQFVRAEYQQLFRSNVMLNIDYTKRASNGILRNSKYDHEDVQLRMKHVGKIYSFDLLSSFSSSRVEQSGGIQNDSLPESYALNFIPVNRASSEIHTQRTDVKWGNYVDFVSDSSRSAGIYTASFLKIKKYNLTEDDTLYGLYPLINYDSLATRDQYQWSATGLAAGLFYSGKYSSIKLTPQLSYWNFQNLGRFNDTVEFNGLGEWSFRKERLKFLFLANYNLAGAQNEWQNKLNFDYSFSGLNVSLNSTIESRLPEYYQRYCVGNNSLPIQGDWSKQTRNLHTIKISRDWKKTILQGELVWASAKNNYWFIDSIWRNDSLTNINVLQAGSTVSHTWKAVNFQLNYRYSLVSGTADIIPEHQIFARIYLKGGIFKARKMISYSGVESGYLSSYSSIGYLPQVAAFSFIPNGGEVRSQILLHYFAGFQIDEFKFFLRLENIQSFWSVKSTQQIHGYPVSPFQIKLGVTWDFFD